MSLGHIQPWRAGSRSPPDPIEDLPPVPGQPEHLRFLRQRPLQQDSLPVALPRVVPRSFHQFDHRLQRQHRAVIGKVKTISVKREGRKWFVVLTAEQ
ncbi:hypothetical protein ACWEQP_35995, partial [Streptomyces sp. NPDC004044]